MHVSNSQPQATKDKAEKSKQKSVRRKLVLGFSGFIAAAIISSGVAGAAQLGGSISQSGNGYGGVGNTINIIITGGQNIIIVVNQFFFGH